VRKPEGRWKIGPTEEFDGAHLLDAKRKRCFKEELNLDPDLFMNPETINQAGLNEVHKQLEKIQGLIKEVVVRDRRSFGCYEP
jgi:hypothetical protein